MRAYKALLFAFPASFRAEYGGEMGALFAHRRRNTSGALPLLALWVQTVWDVIWNASLVQWDLLSQDLRFTQRTLRRSPGFTFAAILVAALGVGATTAAFSITDHVLIRPLPFADPQRLVDLWQTQRGYSRMELSPANYRDWKRMSRSFDATAAFTDASANLVGEGDPERLTSAKVTADLFPLLGTKPLIGRVFADADDREGAPGTLLLSYGLWQRRFGGDSAVVGRNVLLDGVPYLIIGVMSPGFHFPSRETQIWMPMRFGEGDFTERDDLYLRAVGRLRAGVSLKQARADLGVVAARLERAYPKENAQIGATVVRLRDEVSEQSRLLLMALFGAALSVLLIACTNLGSLLLARALFRRKELAVRTALGAGRERLMRQLMTEALVLALCGGVLGVCLAVAATPLVARLVPNALPIAETPEADVRMLVFAALATVVTGIGFGVIPALRAQRGVDATGLREGSRGGVGGSRERLRSALVVTEVAVTVVLLISSGLLIRALWRLQGVDPGFRTEGVLTLRTALPLPKYEKTERRRQFLASVLSDIRALPGVSSAAYISYLPMVMRGGIWSIMADGRPGAPEEPHLASLRFVTPGFFTTLGIPVRAGRDLSESDSADAPWVAVVSESFARRYWPGQDPLGRRLQFGLLGGAPGPSPFGERTVVGVVGDVRVRGLERESEPQLYLSYQQVKDGWLIGYAPKDLAIRSVTDPQGLAPAIRQVIRKTDPQLPVSDVRMLSEIVASDTAPRSVQAGVLAAFAGIAVVLAGVGIHGLLAFTVSSRAQEIGVRIALGAGAGDILKLVLRQGLLLASTGVALGVTLALGTGRALEALLVGLSPRDAATFLAAVAVALIMTLVGSLFPALRAVRVDPMTVIRAE
ncbi:MAG: ABC transporter permease [Vicinamibacteria bacterium]